MKGQNCHCEGASPKQSSILGKRDFFVVLLLVIDSYIEAPSLQSGATGHHFRESVPTLITVFHDFQDRG